MVIKNRTMKKYKVIILIILISLSVLGLFFYYPKATSQNLPQPNHPLAKEEVKESDQIIIEINGVKYNTNYIENMSVYDSMNQLKNEGKINFVEKNYTGMGKFISEINGTRGNGSKNWIYYVNGTEAQVGVSNYKIKARDIISWKYE